MKLGLISLLSCATLIGAQEAVAQPEQRPDSCVPAALLSGVDEVVDELQQQLLLLGVSNRAQTGCPVVRAQVALAEEGISIVLQEPSGRSASIHLSDANIAATWIDSWLREELGAPLLAVRAAPPAAVVSSTPPAPSPAPVQSTISAASTATIWQAGLNYESSTANDDGNWRGLRSEVCMRIGPACFGILARIAENQDDALLTDGFSKFSQTAIDALVQVQIPIAIGRSSLVPQVALGGSWISTTRSALEDDCIVIQDGPGCATDFLDDNANTRASLAPQIETGLSLSVPLASAVRLQLGTSLNLRPLGQSAEAVQGPEAPPPACEIPDDPSCVDIEPWPLLAMPRDPERFWRLSIGLQVQL